ncbi:hypothetical protein ACA910_008099 [Epithemia clementina (nom. ined.)]
MLQQHHNNKNNNNDNARRPEPPTRGSIIPDELEDLEDNTIVSPLQRGLSLEEETNQATSGGGSPSTASPTDASPVVVAMMQSSSTSTTTTTVSQPPRPTRTPTATAIRREDSDGTHSLFPGISSSSTTTSTIASRRSSSINNIHNNQHSSWRWSLPREVRSLLAGGIAGMAAKSVVAPMDRIKILYQVSSAEFHFRSIPQVIRNIVQTEGVAALWKGNTATMIRVFPYSGIQFMVFDRCKRFFLNEHEQHGRYLTTNSSWLSSSSSSTTTLVSSSHKRKNGLTALESLVGGMVAGTISVVCTYPLDLTRAQLAVLKTHKQQQPQLHNANATPRTTTAATAITAPVVAARTKGFVTVLVDNYTQRGVAGLFRGISPTLLGILPYSGVAFTLNEQSKREIQHFTKRDLTTMERMQCGAFAGLVAQSVTYPIEVIRRRMQTIGLNDTALDCLGGGGGKNATTTTTTSPAPASTIVAQPPLKPQPFATPQPDTLWGTIRHLHAEQGMRGFFKGVSVNWMKGPIAFSISFTTFDIVQGLLEPPRHVAVVGATTTTRSSTQQQQPEQQQQHAALHAEQHQQHQWRR